jgi:hypothetical protein
MFQAFVTRYLSDGDVESSNWVKQKLDNSVEPNLLVQVKQRFDKLPITQQGGLTLWKLLVDTLYANSYENKTLIVNFLTNQKLSNTPGHDVSIAATCFIAAARSLDPCDLPSLLVQDFLRCMSDCRVEDFTDTVRAYKGAIKIQDNSTVDQLSQLDIIAAKLTAEYRTLLKKKEWIDAGSKSSAFKITPTPKNPADMPQLKPGQVLRSPDPGWQAWFDKQTCDECGEKHPTKHHNDVGIRNRNYIYTPPAVTHRKPNTISRRTNPNPRTNSRPRPQRPIRYRPGGKKAMQQAVHKAWLECIEPEDHDLMAHLAGGLDNDDEPDMFANLAEGDETADADDDADNEESIFQAFAVAGLESLNWQAA